MDLISVKQRFEIIGFTPELDRALEIAIQVAPTDLSVLIYGESGVGKENFPKIIHQNSLYKHGPYIAVNCGAIPEGTIDSELFGHEKGAFTGALDKRKGYFEEAQNGTIFLDEVAELPLATQARLLRVLESGEFLRVGSSQVQKVQTRVVAATNVDLMEMVGKGKFRKDLYFRLNTVPIYIPPLRERKSDIPLLFKKFARDFAEKYKIPVIQLTPAAQEVLQNYPWYGNVRQLKNITEQISIIETDRMITDKVLSKYLETYTLSKLPVVVSHEAEKNERFEMDLIYQLIADLKREVADLKTVVGQLMQNHNYKMNATYTKESKFEFKVPDNNNTIEKTPTYNIPQEVDEFQETEVVDEKFSIEEQEKDLIKKALEKYKRRRKQAATELGISERTLYRKIKEYHLE